MIYNLVLENGKKVVRLGALPSHNLPKKLAKVKTVNS